ncbi:hypothetical protein ACFL3A_04390 [Pseudomonadota bacterium]
MIKSAFKTLALALPVVVTILSGCTGSRTFHDHANAGDSVAVAAGWMHNMQRGNIEVKITDSLGAETIYTPGQPGYDAVKASINFYPDPVSSMVVSDRIDKSLTPAVLVYSNLINQEITNYDHDWWETVIFIDLPDPMALGDATINITSLSVPVETMSSVVTIVPDATGTGTGGTPNAFEAKLGSFPFNMDDAHFQGLERVPNYEVAFSSSTLPYAIQVNFTHDPDEANSGTGTPYVINPIGHIKNLSWAATGTSGTDLRVILTPARDGAITNMNDFKFYVAGGVTNLAPNGSVQAFDIDGEPVPGVSVTITNN